MRAGKAFAVAVICGMLAAQAWTIASRQGGWYWPFMDYPMYSLSKQRGDAVILLEFRAQGCDAASEPEVVGNAVLGIEPFRFWELLDAARRPDGDRRVDPTTNERDARAILTDLVRERRGRRTCEAQVWGRSYRIGVDPPERLRQPFSVIARWTVSEGDGA